MPENMYGYVECSECGEIAVPTTVGYNNVQKDGYTAMILSFISYETCLKCGTEHQESS